ncbi:hypothetical protein AN644_04305 [Candidatus Epulonipiscium fishelsonii]|nr:hypothetical protein AN644_04305 [Epulopiscium sp. SCG-C06WGA-EpuloA1]
MDKIILIYLQSHGNCLEEVSLELLGKAKELAELDNFKVYGVYIGSDKKEIIKMLKGYPLDYLVCCDTDKIYDVNYKSNILSEMCKEFNPEIFLIGATKEGRSLAPCIAAQIGCGLTADCTEIGLMTNGKLLQIRPALEEKVLAYICTSTKLQMATVRPNIIEKPSIQENTTFEVILYKIDEFKSNFNIIKVVPIKKEINISEEKFLIVIGAGVTNKDDLIVLEKWANYLGVKLACTRKIVERGWFNIERQIGLSGNSSKADYMLTIGVSGSIQFQAGIHKVKHIIAINNDKDTNIMSIAREAILLDIDLFIEELKHKYNY